MVEADSKTSSPKNDEDEYENGNIVEYEDSPTISVRSVFDRGESLCNYCPSRNHLKQNNFTVPDKWNCNQRILAFGPHIHASEELEQKNYDTNSYCTPFENSPKDSKKFGRNQLGDLSGGFQEAKTLNISKSTSVLEKPQVIQNTNPKLAFNKIWSVTSTEDIQTPAFCIEKDNKCEFIDLIKVPKPKAKRISDSDNLLKVPNMFHNRNEASCKGLSKSFTDDKNTLKIPSESDSQLFFVNDINMSSWNVTASIKSKKHRRRRQKSDVLWSAASGKQSVFSKESLDLRYQQMNRLIYDSPFTNASSHAKKKKKMSSLRKNVEKMLRSRNKHSCIEIISGAAKSHRY